MVELCCVWLLNDCNLVNNGSMNPRPPDSLAATPPWQHLEPVSLLPHVRRLTAPNPGMMTGPGTNSYIIGTPDVGYIVIDPGPNDAEHIERLFDATQGDIKAIVCTHSHPDHSPAAKPLQALCRKSINSDPAIYGLPSGPDAELHSLFTPDVTLQNLEHITLISSRQQANLTPKLSLQVIFTPGHTVNHVCLALLEDGILFSGDHILNGSTTVINPPDGHMGDYLASLDTLAQLCKDQAITHILPAHGHVLPDALHVIAHLKAHRLGREEKIAGVMQAYPHGSMDDWVRHAYDDVSPHLWPIAKRSLLAHVQHIQSKSKPDASASAPSIQ